MCFDYPFGQLKAGCARRVLALPIGILALVALILLPWPVHAQTDRATLEGTIWDSKGGTIAGARVQITELDTGLGYERVTNALGFYRIPGLPHGRYTVIVTRDGFQTKQIDEVELQVGETHTLDAVLAVGAVSERVEVKAEAEPYERNSAE